MEPDIYALSKAGFSKERIEEITRCDDKEIQIRMLRIRYLIGLGTLGYPAHRSRIRQKVKSLFQSQLAIFNRRSNTLDGVLYDTPLAEEIKAYFPLTISMSGYGGREYYGGVDFYLENLEDGQKSFENLDSREEITFSLAQ